MTPVPNVGTKTLVKRTFFKRFVVNVEYCAKGFQKITRKHEYYNEWISLFNFAPFDPETDTYDDRYKLIGLIFFRFSIVFADLKKQKF